MTMIQPTLTPLCDISSNLLTSVLICSNGRRFESANIPLVDMLLTDNLDHGAPARDTVHSPFEFSLYPAPITVWHITGRRIPGR